MRRVRCTTGMLLLALAIGACAGDDPSATPSPTPVTTPTATGPSAPTTPTPPPSPLTPPATTCDRSQVLATIATAVTVARLAPVTAWSEPSVGDRFADRTTTGDGYAARLGLDCGLVAAESLASGDERLVVAAWTGGRMAWVVQTTEDPSAPYSPDATVTVVVGDTEGEFLDGDARSLWAGTLASGETFVVGHVDFNLGAAAKDWVADDRPPDDEPSDDALLLSERHAIAVLEAAGMREVGIAEPAEIGSREGHVMFVSPTGQISVADVAPTGWFDPMLPRYYTGATRIETIDGVPVRVTAPGPDDRYAVAAEIGFSCDEFAWLLQPPGNGDVDELLASATAVLSTLACRAR